MVITSDRSNGDVIINDNNCNPSLGERVTVDFTHFYNSVVSQNARYTCSVFDGIVLQRGQNFFLATNTPPCVRKDVHSV